jgi:hypothetical protein
MRCWAAVAIFFAGLGLASAQVGEISVSGGVSRFGSASLGTSLDQSGNVIGNAAIKDGFRLGFRFTLNTYRFAGHEFGYAYSRSGVDIGGQNVPMSIQQGFYDFLLYATPEGSRIRPFAAGGVEFSSFFPPGASVYYGNQETKFGVNYGGGLKVRVTEIIGLRFDVREYSTGMPFKFSHANGWLNQLEATVGAAFLF